MEILICYKKECGLAFGFYIAITFKSYVVEIRNAAVLAEPSSLVLLRLQNEYYLSVDQLFVICV